MTRHADPTTRGVAHGSALLSNRAGGESFARLMESAIATGAASKRGVDWIIIGQMMRDELD